MSWPSLVAKECSIEDLEKSFQLMFPGRSVKALIFSSISEGDDVEAMNAYIAERGPDARPPHADVRVPLLVGEGPGPEAARRAGSSG